MNAIPLRQRIGHGFLAVPLSFVGLPIYMYAPDFYALEFTIPLATIGFVLLALRVVDALQDPFIGALSDRYANHRGAITLIGAIMLASGFWLLFNPYVIIFTHKYALVWLSLSVLISTTGFSVISINLQAAGGLWPVGADERTSIAVTREALGLVGLLMAAVVPALLFNYLPRPAAFHWLSILFLPLLAAGVWAFLHWLKHTQLVAPSVQRTVNFRSLFANSWRNRFLFIYTLSTFASAIPGVLVVFYVRDYLQLHTYTGLFLMVYFLSGVLAMPLWQTLAERTGKKNAWAASMVLACITFSGAFFLEANELIAFCLVCVCSGMALGADLALPQAIMADEVAQQPAAASRYYALMAFLSKAALALATGIILPFLGLLGFEPGSAKNNHLLPYAYALIPCCIKLVCAGCLLYCARRYCSVHSTSVKKPIVIRGI